MNAAQEALDWLRSRDRPDPQPSGLGFERDPARALAIMRQRAVQLAAVAVQRARASASADFLIFRAGGARYALSLVALREAAPLPAIAAVPGAAQTVRGVMPWRGEFATVFDIAAALGLAAHDGAAAYAIVLRQGAPRMALAIESAEGAARIDTADMRAADAWQAGRADLLRGATADGVAILDEARLRARLSEELRAA